ncbi:MAG: 6-phospho-beta-glucosidase [Anaerolineaceae bacterium]|nr:6-phospho-beta-glucosidase [Anaerolineaceae bacterium]
MKVSVIGGGSTYTPELINGFIDMHDTFPITELWLMDIDTQRLDIVGKLAQRMTAARGNPFKVILTTNQLKAVRSSAYIINQFRVGCLPARREDEYLGKKYGLIGQETTGVGGMAKAMRTIPVVLSIADDIRKSAPDALLANFTNPSGLITEALTRHAPDIHTVGVCNEPITMKMAFLEGLEKLTGEKVLFEDTFLDTLGLNHLSWHRGFQIKGRDVWPQIMEGFIQMLKSDSDYLPDWDIETIESLGMIPNNYLSYYYRTPQRVAQQDNWPPSRAETVMQVEKDLLEKYAQPDRIKPPDELMLRGGAWYSTLASRVLNSHFNNLGEIYEVSTQNKGAVPEWPQDWVLEFPCSIDAKGIHPLPTKPLPPVCFGLLSAVKAYELLTVEAAVHGDYDAAYQALLVHPLGPRGDLIKILLDDMLEINKPYIPQFSKE